MDQDMIKFRRGHQQLTVYIIMDIVPRPDINL